MKITFKRNERETGLSAVGAPERGWGVRVDGEQIGSISSMRKGFGPTTGWYWVIYSAPGVPYVNTCNRPSKTSDEAKAAAKAYLLAHLKATPAESK